MYDHLPALEAALWAWTTPGPDPFYHEAVKDDIRRLMPLLGRALDRAEQERGKQHESHMGHR